MDYVCTDHGEINCADCFMKPRGLATAKYPSRKRRFVEQAVISMASTAALHNRQAIDAVNDAISLWNAIEAEFKDE